MDAVRVIRSGWTLHEMLISVAVTGGVFVLASHAALGHLRFFRGTGEIAALRSQLGHVTAVAANLLRAVESAEDILVAQDSAAEVLASYGAAFACAADTGAVVLPSPRDGTASAIAAFGDAPQPGDYVRLLVEDDSSASWVNVRVATSPQWGGTCPAFPTVASTWKLDLVEPVVVSAGAALRFSRRTRISGYRASDGRWYLGIRDWNGSADRFNTVQPVAGPVRSFSADGAATGFLLSWADSSGATLPPPIDPARVATITIVARGETVRPARVPGLRSDAAALYEDSLATAVSLRNK